ncbi:MAG: UDP binding domain-containing protein, partial [Gemmatimonadales bacterium]
PRRVNVSLPSLRVDKMLQNIPWMVNSVRKSGLTMAVEAANEAQKQKLFQKVRHALGNPLDGARIAIWGLAFKAETDDMRESPSIQLIENLLQCGAAVTAHDPQATETARAIFGDRITYCGDMYDAVKGADALVIVTEWQEFRNPDFDRVASLLNQPVVVDGRNLYRPERMRERGFRYYSFGRA